ncbi:MAG: PIN domain-containing protein [Micrococcales bacterium]|nr:PIN domain-containing protein [Micrococcales bacterium]
MKRAILDTNVLIDGRFGLGPGFELAVTAVSYAELEFGANLPTISPEQRAMRLQSLNRLRARFGAGLPFDDAAAASYGLITRLVLESGRQVRGRAHDLMIAAIAHVNGAALITADLDDFGSLDPLVRIIRP